MHMQKVNYQCGPFDVQNIFFSKRNVDLINSVQSLSNWFMKLENLTRGLDGHVLNNVHRVLCRNLMR